jgi:seryl-tRNA synthetase
MSTESFRQDLLNVGLLRDGGVDGVYHRSFAFEKIARGVEAYVSAAGGDENRQQLYFSQVMARSTLEGSGYLRSFPDLIGTISSFAGSESELPQLLRSVEAGEDWTALMTPTDVVLCSAGCHSVYPLVAGTPIPMDGLLFETQASVFRHEPSSDPARMQSFRQHEFVFLGTEQGAIEHRDEWLARGLSLMSDLELAVEAVVANDPFFGRAGQLLAAGQREKALKYEIVTPISSEVVGAISSANCHRDHFGASFGLATSDGKVAHTSCIGFGLERITLALLLQHGLDSNLWPSEIQQRLSLTSDSLPTD